MIGVGNPHAGDDAVGLTIAAALRGRTWAAAVAVRSIEGDTVALLDLWADAGAVVLVDAVRSGAPAGTLLRADAGAQPLPTPLRRGSSTHAVGVAEAIELARVLGRLPGRVVVYGVEGARFEAGAGLSAAVAAAVPAVIERVAREVGELVALQAQRR